jgi:hypothetical protein
MPDRRRVARTLLDQCIWDREATYEEQVAEFMTFARQLKEQATLSVRHLQRLAAGPPGRPSPRAPIRVCGWPWSRRGHSRNSASPGSPFLRSTVLSVSATRTRSMTT